MPRTTRRSSRKAATAAAEERRDDSPDAIPAVGGHSNGTISNGMTTPKKTQRQKQQKQQKQKGPSSPKRTRSGATYAQKSPAEAAGNTIGAAVAGKSKTGTAKKMMKKKKSDGTAPSAVAKSNTKSARSRSARKKSPSSSSSDDDGSGSNSPSLYGAEVRRVTRELQRNLDRRAEEYFSSDSDGGSSNSKSGGGGGASTGGAGATGCKKKKKGGGGGGGGPTSKKSCGGTKKERDGMPLDTLAQEFGAPTDKKDLLSMNVLAREFNAPTDNLMPIGGLEKFVQQADDAELLAAKEEEDKLMPLGCLKEFREGAKKEKLDIGEEDEEGGGLMSLAGVGAVLKDAKQYELNIGKSRSTAPPAKATAEPMAEVEASSKETAGSSSAGSGGTRSVLRHGVPAVLWTKKKEEEGTGTSSSSPRSPSPAKAVEWRVQIGLEAMNAQEQRRASARASAGGGRSSSGGIAAGSGIPTTVEPTKKTDAASCISSIGSDSPQSDWFKRLLRTLTRSSPSPTGGGSPTSKKVELDEKQPAAREQETAASGQELVGADSGGRAAPARPALVPTSGRRTFVKKTTEDAHEKKAAALSADSSKFKVGDEVVATDPKLFQGVGTIMRVIKKDEGEYEYDVYAFNKNLCMTQTEFREDWMEFASAEDKMQHPQQCPPYSEEKLTTVAKTSVDVGGRCQYPAIQHADDPDESNGRRVVKEGATDDDDGKVPPPGQPGEFLQNHGGFLEDEQGEESTDDGREAFDAAREKLKEAMSGLSSAIEARRSATHAMMAKRDKKSKARWAKLMEQRPWDVESYAAPSEDSPNKSGGSSPNLANAEVSTVDSGSGRMMTSAMAAPSYHTNGPIKQLSQQEKQEQLYKKFTWTRRPEEWGDKKPAGMPKTPGFDLSDDDWGKPSPTDGDLGKTNVEDFLTRSVMSKTTRPGMVRDDGAATADVTMFSDAETKTKAKVGTINANSPTKSNNGGNGNDELLSSAIMTSVHPLKQQGRPEWTLQQQTKHKQLMTDSDGSPQLGSMGGRGGARAREERDAKMPAGMLMERESYSSDEESGGNLHLGNFVSVTAAAHDTGTGYAKADNGTMVDGMLADAKKDMRAATGTDGAQYSNSIMAVASGTSPEMDLSEIKVLTKNNAAQAAQTAVLVKKTREAAARLENTNASRDVQPTLLKGAVVKSTDTDDAAGEDASIDYSTACTNTKREKERRTASKAPTKHPNRALTAATFAGGDAGVGGSGTGTAPGRITATTTFGIDGGRSRHIKAPAFGSRGGGPDASTGGGPAGKDKADLVQQGGGFDTSAGCASFARAPSGTTDDGEDRFSALSAAGDGSIAHSELKDEQKPPATPFPGTGGRGPPKSISIPLEIPTRSGVGSSGVVRNGVGSHTPRFRSLAFNTAFNTPASRRMQSDFALATPGSAMSASSIVRIDSHRRKTDRELAIDAERMALKNRLAQETKDRILEEASALILCEQNQQDIQKQATAKLADVWALEKEDFEESAKNQKQILEEDHRYVEWVAADEAGASLNGTAMNLGGILDGDAGDAASI